MLKFRCEACGQKLGVPEKFAGKRIRCVKCSEPTRVPEPEVRLEEDDPAPEVTRPRRRTSQPPTTSRSQARPAQPAPRRPATTKPAEKPSAPDLDGGFENADDSGLALLGAAEAEADDALTDLSTHEAQAPDLPPALRPPALRPSAKPKKPRKVRQPRGPVDASVRMHDVFMAPFQDALLIIAVQISLGAGAVYFGGAVLGGVVLGFLGLEGDELETWGMRWLAMLGLLVVLWMSKRYCAVVRAAESGERYAPEERSALMDVFRLLLVTLGALALPLIGLAVLMGLGMVGGMVGGQFGSGAAGALIALFVVCSTLIWIVYWPIGMGMAAAYGTVNPLAVLGKIVRNIGPCVILFGWMLLFLFVSAFVFVGIRALLTSALLMTADFLPIALIFAILAAFLTMVWGQFYIVGCLASVGVFLRRYRFR